MITAKNPQQRDMQTKLPGGARSRRGQHGKGSSGAGSATPQKVSELT